MKKLILKIKNTIILMDFKQLSHVANLLKNDTKSLSNDQLQTILNGIVSVKEGLSNDQIDIIEAVNLLKDTDSKEQLSDEQILENLCSIEETKMYDSFIEKDEAIIKSNKWEYICVYFNNQVAKPLSYYIFRCHCGRIGCKRPSFKNDKCSKLCGHPTTRYIKDFMIKNGLIPNFNKYYYGNKCSLQFICKCGNVDIRPWTTINDNPGCRKCTGNRKKLTIDQVRDYFNNEGYTLLSKIYDGSAGQLTCKCDQDHVYETTFNRFQSGHRCPECDRLSRMNIDVQEFLKKKDYRYIATRLDTNSNGDSVYRIDFECDKGHEDTVNQKTLTSKTDKWMGCKECRKILERNDYNDVFDFFESKGCILLSEEYKNNKEPLEFICTCGQVSTISYSALRRGRRCNLCAKERAEKTSLIKYNETNPAKSEQVKQKAKDTNKKRYNVEHIMKNPEFVKKAQATNLKRYGKKYAFMLDAVYEKIKKINQEKLGVDYPFQNPVFLEYALEQAHIVWKEKYGVEWPVLMKDFREKCIITSQKNWGVNHPMQNLEILNKAIRNAFRFKEFVFPSGRIDRVQGYEPTVLQQLLDSGIHEDEIFTNDSGEAHNCDFPKIFYNDPCTKQQRRYYPDIWLPNMDKFIEVKSEWTFNLQLDINIAKFMATARQGYEIEVRILNGKKICTLIKVYTRQDEKICVKDYDKDFNLLDTTIYE